MINGGNSMKRRIVILIALAVLITSTFSYAASSETDKTVLQTGGEKGFTYAVVSADKLNVREGPSTTYNSICKLDKGQTVTVIGRLGDWYAIYDDNMGIVGAVDGRYIDLGDDAVTVASIIGDEAVTAAKNKDKAVPEKEKTPEKIILSADEQKLLELVNKARKEKGVDELAIDAGLMKVARLKAKDMIENNYFSHQSPTYGSPFDMMRQFDNVFKSAGENIAGNKTVEGAFKAWMASDSHKKNILNSGFKVTGIGIEDSPTYGKIVVQQFIGR
jgi:uncharacterized YkwD family protein